MVKRNIAAHMIRETGKNGKNGRNGQSKNSTKGVKRSHNKRGTSKGHLHTLGNSTSVHSVCSYCRPEIARKLAQRREINEGMHAIKNQKANRDNYHNYYV